MPSKQGTNHGQSLRRSTRYQKAPTPEPTSDNSGMISRSPTPAWLGGIDPNHPDADKRAELEAPRSPQGETEEDPFFPTTQQVAATLVAMRSGRESTDDRGQEVRHIGFGIGGDPWSLTHNVQHGQQQGTSEQPTTPAMGTKCQLPSGSHPRSRRTQAYLNSTSPCLPTLCLPTGGWVAD